MPIYATNVYVPYIELYLEIEVEGDTTLQELGETIQKATANDNQLRIFRFKYNENLLGMNTKLRDIPGYPLGSPRHYLKALAQMTGA